MKTLLLLIVIAMIKPTTLKIESPSFSNNGFIPSKYTCDGSNINPEIDIRNIPAQAKSIVLLVDDPDAPLGNFDHWVMWNIPVKGKIAENSAPGVQGRNGKKENTWTGPCPPSGTHHYHFKVYALDTLLDLPSDSDKNDVIKAMETHVLASGELVGLYKRTN